MANNKNINELVTDDDDPTAELEALTPASELTSQVEDGIPELGADTSDFFDTSKLRTDPSLSALQADLLSRSETIERLQFDIEQLHAKWTGLEAEIKAREELTDSLHKELGEATKKLSRKDRLLKKRNTSVKSLKAEIRKRNDEYETLQAAHTEQTQLAEELQQKLAAENSSNKEQRQTLADRQSGQIASLEAGIGELSQQLEQSESYADSLRHIVQERTAAMEEAVGARELLKTSLAKASKQIEQLEASLDEVTAISETQRGKLDTLQDAHAEEIRMLRFELGEAQETVSQHELATEQLATSLLDTRGSRDELEQMLSKVEDSSNSRIEEMEKDNRRLLREAAENQEKLDTKSEAINCLLAELAKKSQQIESIGDIEEVIQDIDDRMSERIDERVYKDRERLSRVLIGTVDGQELRFPLFKNRLTIGRTEQNDIHLDVAYVSRRHAVIVTEQDTTRVIDWGSKNGVFVNSERVTEHFLHSGDAVTIGTAEFRYEERPKRDS